MRRSVVLFLLLAYSTCVTSRRYRRSRGRNGSATIFANKPPRATNKSPIATNKQNKNTTKNVNAKRRRQRQRTKGRKKKKKPTTKTKEECKTS